MQIWIATNNRDVPRVMKTKFRATLMVFSVVSSEDQHHATSYLRSRLESQHQNVLGCAEECGDTLVQSAGCGRPWVWQQDSAPAISPMRPRLGSEELLRLCTLLSLVPLLPQPESAGLLRLVIRREHHQHDLPQDQSLPDGRHLPSICRAPAGACGKGMLPVTDPHRGSD